MITDQNGTGKWIDALCLLGGLLLLIAFVCEAIATVSGLLNESGGESFTAEVIHTAVRVL